MKCPQCGTSMVEGKTHISDGSFPFLSGGISVGNLTFTGVKWGEHVVQDTSDVLPAHYCDNCEAVAIETNRSGLSTLEA